MSSDLQYPIGPFRLDGPVTEAHRSQWIGVIAQTPTALSTAIEGLSPVQLDTPYRPGGWTVRQVVHHLVDSHLNSYIRFRLALTEAQPQIKPFDEAAWAELADARTAPVELSLGLLAGLHARWVLLLQSLSRADFARTLQHPQSGTLNLDQMLGLYAWHGAHHVAHITGLRERNGW